ncbi:MAG: glycosyltransferase family 4 protein [Candidatus Woesearchaeota archaeon]|nr:MAG: glycosyltransferase family 4 protein [Candidatus Woesearchaeota archaeon]
MLVTSHSKRSVLLCVNSDFGVPNTIGFRTTPIAQLLEEKQELAKVICRDYAPGILAPEHVKRPIPLGNLVPKLLSACDMIFPGAIPGVRLKRNLFMHFAKSYVARHAENASLIHFWDYSKELAQQAKDAGLLVVQDVAIGMPREACPHEKEALIGAASVADAIIVPSPYVKQTLQDLGLDTSKVHIVPFGVDATRFTPQQKKAKTFTVAFVGNINLRKGIDCLVQAWKELALPHAKLMLYGRVYPEVNEYLKDAKKHNIVVCGFVDPAKKLPLADVFAFPSTNEGSAKAVYEALACGLPVITTFNAGSVITEGKEGFIIPTKNVAKLKEKLLLLYRDAKLRKKMGLQARKTAETYSWQRYATSVRDVYASLEK